MYLHKYKMDGRMATPIVIGDVQKTGAKTRTGFRIGSK